MELEIDKVFTPLKIKIQTEEELKELVGIFACVSGSSIIESLYHQLSEQLDSQMYGLFEGGLERNLQEMDHE